MIDKLAVVIETMKHILPMNYESMKLLVASVNELEIIVKEYSNDVNNKCSP